jgi:23S rRNA (cytidine1920-2'-O)/16S rRNA (cytidine1409-2'-O)-methyltransferase
MPKQRLDTLLTERGLFSSRSRAAASVMAGEVMLGAERRRASKPSEMVDLDSTVDVNARASFVSRGGIKLANALAASGLEVAARRALDVGVSTGGFTDCLLQAGVRDVIAVDVGYGDLSWGLRNDPRVVVLERTNARHMQPDQLPWRPDLAVIDVAFISLRKVLPAVLACLTERFDVLGLVKPQFEVGRQRVGKGGVVRDAAVRRDALVAVGRCAQELGATVLAFHASGLAGPKGNLESFIWLAEAGRGGGATSAEDLLALAREVEA